MTPKERQADDIRRIEYLLGLIRDGSDGRDYLTIRMLHSAFEALFTACNQHLLLPEGWGAVLYPSTAPVAEEVGDGA